MNKDEVRKTAGVASLVLGLLAWLGQKYQWFTVKVTDGMNVLSLGFGLVATAA